MFVNRHSVVFIQIVHSGYFGQLVLRGGPSSPSETSQCRSRLGRLGSPLQGWQRIIWHNLIKLCFAKKKPVFSDKLSFHVEVFLLQFRCALKWTRQTESMLLLLYIKHTGRFEPYMHVCSVFNGIFYHQFLYVIQLLSKKLFCIKAKFLIL